MMPGIGAIRILRKMRRASPIETKQIVIALADDQHARASRHHLVDERADPIVFALSGPCRLVRRHQRKVVCASLRDCMSRTTCSRRLWNAAGSWILHQ